MLLALVLAVLAGPAASSVEVRWDSAPGCLDEQEFRDQLVAMVEVPPEDPITLRATQDAQGEWIVGVGFADTQRELHGRDCALLTEAAALIVAIRIDPLATAASVQSTPAPEVEATPPGRTLEAPAVEPPEDTKPLPPLRDSRPPAQRIPIAPPEPTGGVHVGGDIGSLPRGGATFGGDASVRWKRARIDLGAFAVLGPPTAEASAGTSAAFRVFSGVVRGCGVIAAQQWEAPLCAGVEVGVLQARPTDLPNDVDAVWLAPTAGVRLQRWFSSVAPGVFLVLAVPILQHRFDSARFGTVHTVDPVVFRAGFALRFRGRGGA